MFPGMDKRAMEAAMRKLGVRQQELDVREVLIRLNNGREIVVTSPSVAKVTMMGQETFQVSGQHVERQQESQQQRLFGEEDVKTVVAQSGVSDAEAKVALAKVNGDLAAAIMLLEKGK